MCLPWTLEFMQVLWYSKVERLIIIVDREVVFKACWFSRGVKQFRGNPTSGYINLTMSLFASHIHSFRQPLWDLLQHKNEVIINGISETKVMLLTKLFTSLVRTVFSQVRELHPFLSAVCYCDDVTVSCGLFIPTQVVMMEYTRII